MSDVDVGVRGVGFWLGWALPDTHAHTHTHIHTHSCTPSIHPSIQHAVRGLDVGTGASAIYPLLGARVYGWAFLGTDIDECVLRCCAVRIALLGWLCVVMCISRSPPLNNPHLTTPRRQNTKHRVALEAARANVARNSLGARIALKRVQRADYSACRALSPSYPAALS